MEINRRTWIPNFLQYSTLHILLRLGSQHVPHATVLEFCCTNIYRSPSDSNVLQKPLCCFFAYMSLHEDSSWRNHPSYECTAVHHLDRSFCTKMPPGNVEGIVLATPHIRHFLSKVVLASPCHEVALHPKPRTLTYKLSMVNLPLQPLKIFRTTPTHSSTPDPLLNTKKHAVTPSPNPRHPRNTIRPRVLKGCSGAGKFTALGAESPG